MKITDVDSETLRKLLLSEPPPAPPLGGYEDTLRQKLTTMENRELEYFAAKLGVDIRGVGRMGMQSGIYDKLLYLGEDEIKAFLQSLDERRRQPRRQPRRQTVDESAQITKTPIVQQGTDAGRTLADLVRPHLNIPEATLSPKEIGRLAEKKIAEFPLQELVHKAVETKVREMTPIREIHIRTEANAVPKVLPRQHFLFPLMLKLAEQRLHAYLVGPAGSGKTQTVENVAEALGKKFFSISVCSQSTEYVLKGYFDAQGNYVRSLFREAYENGGVFLIDEIDAGNPNIIACLNAALSNHVCAFPDGMVKKHEDFILFAAANTWGVGSSREYVGRNPLDGATLDRFVFVEFPYDPGLEHHMVGCETKTSPPFNLEDGEAMSAEAWVGLVQKIRASVQELGIKAIVSPRASKTGAIMLRAGIGSKHVMNGLIWKGLDKGSVEKIKSAAGIS